MVRGYTTVEQSKKLAEILPLESADMFWRYNHNIHTYDDIPKILVVNNWDDDYNKNIPCWSLATLLKCLSEIKPQVYIPVLFPNEGKWILRFVEYGHGNVCEECDSDPVDACVVMIQILHKLKIL